MRLQGCVAALAAMSFSGAAFAQAPEPPLAAPPPPPAPTASTAVAGVPAPAIVPAGTKVVVEIAVPVSTTTVKRGDTFAIRLVSAITFNDRVIVPAGANGVGQVVDAAPSGALGRPAKLLLAARYIEFNGAHLALHGMRLGAAGEDQTATIAAATAFVPYVGILTLFMHGGEIDIPAGTLAEAKLAVDLPAGSVTEPAPTSASAAMPTTVATVATAPAESPTPASPTSQQQGNRP